MVQQTNVSFQFQDVIVVNALEATVTVKLDFNPVKGTFAISSKQTTKHLDPNKERRATNRSVVASLIAQAEEKAVELASEFGHEMQENSLFSGDKADDVEDDEPESPRSTKRTRKLEAGAQF